MLKGTRVRTTLWLLFYALLAGISLSLFSFMDTMIKYLFSILAIYTGFRFFRQFEGIGLRIMFIAMSIIFYFVTALITAMYVYVRDNPDLLTSSL